MQALRDGCVSRLLERHPYEPLSANGADDEEQCDDYDSCPAFIDDSAHDSDDAAAVVSDPAELADGNSDDGASANEQRYEVQEVVSHRGSGSRLEYQVRWCGYSDTTWEPANNLAGAKDSVREYNERRLASVVPQGRSGLRSQTGGHVAAAMLRSDSHSTASADDSALPSPRFHDCDHSDDDDDDAVLAHPAARAALRAVGCSRL
jgi:hypothetical protein